MVQIRSLNVENKMRGERNSVSKSPSWKWAIVFMESLEQKEMETLVKKTGLHM